MLRNIVRKKFPIGNGQRTDHHGLRGRPTHPDGAVFFMQALAATDEDDDDREKEIP